MVEVASCSNHGRFQVWNQMTQVVSIVLTLHPSILPSPHRRPKIWPNIKNLTGFSVVLDDSSISIYLVNNMQHNTHDMIHQVKTTHQSKEFNQHVSLSVLSQRHLIFVIFSLISRFKSPNDLNVFQPHLLGEVKSDTEWRRSWDKIRWPTVWTCWNYMTLLVIIDYY